MIYLLANLSSVWSSFCRPLLCKAELADCFGIVEIYFVSVEYSMQA